MHRLQASTCYKLFATWTGRKINKYTFFLICFFWLCWIVLIIISLVCKCFHSCDLCCVCWLQANSYYKLFITWTSQKIKKTFVRRNMFEFNHIKVWNSLLRDRIVISGGCLIFIAAGCDAVQNSPWCFLTSSFILAPGGITSLVFRPVLFQVQGSVPWRPTTIK